MNEREQIINFLLQACDQKNGVISELQKQLAEFNKQKAVEEKAAKKSASKSE